MPQNPRAATASSWPSPVCNPNPLPLPLHSPLTIRTDRPASAPARPQVAFAFGSTWAIIFRMAALEPGACFSRHASNRLYVSSMLANSRGFLNAARHVGTMARRRSHTTQISPLRSEEHTSELQSRQYLVCRLLLEKKK